MSALLIVVIVIIIACIVMSARPYEALTNSPKKYKLSRSMAAEMGTIEATGEEIAQYVMKVNYKNNNDITVTFIQDLEIIRTIDKKGKEFYDDIKIADIAAQ